jgi:diacylglycerol kinase (ATP)
LPPDQTPQKPSRLSTLFRLHPDIQATLSSNPDDYSPITSRSRMASLRYALAGWLYMLRYQKNVRIQIVATALVFIVGLWVRIEPLGWAILILTILANWMAEFLNAAIEAVVNVASPGIHPMARVSKDVAAAASLLAAVAAVIIGVLILGPPLIQKVSPLLVQFLLTH